MRGVYTASLTLALSLAAQSVADSVVEYFYSSQLDYCYWGQNDMPADNQTANGGLCAYVPSVERVYACPAANQNCWTFGQTCAGGQNPGQNQILCTDSEDASAQWCCQSQETCTLTPGQYNVCISKFDNPLANVDAAQAEQELYSAIPSSAIVTAEPAQATPSVFSTSTFATGGASSSPTPSSGLNSANPSSSTESSGASSNSISGGAIAGIVIGALAGIAIVAGIIAYLIVRRRRANHAVALTSNEKPPLDGTYYQPSYPPQNGKQYMPQNAYMAEAPSDAAVQKPLEMDGSQYGAPANAQSPHELA